MADEPKNFDPEQPVVAFDYLKTPNFQSLRADGVIGGITPSGRIHMAIYSERPAIPRRLTYKISESGELGELVEVQSRDSIVREMSADVFLDLQTAEAMIEWLSSQVKELKNRGGET
ncbi:hypothetical protein [Puniceibacterium sp. IMCC21224]|uniref:hypothetical protein n=1 Tax=Puniceibacterium sp. IMCC21224 TaxID=1618204 RepID=UPI0012E005AA|nr:hypothetical protein [Puniceibacterium sp. IMCC21224]